MTEVFQTDSPDETLRLGRRLAERFEAGDVVALIGKLGAGKTVLVRGIAMGLGITDKRLVSSPTYVLVQEYHARIPVYHVDLYRLAAPSEELAELGIEEMTHDGVVLIEWADRATDALPCPHWRVRFYSTGAASRRIELDRIR